MLCVDTANDASEDHVDRGGVEHGRQEDEGGGDGVGGDLVGVVEGPDAGCVSAYLDCVK